MTNVQGLPNLLRAIAARLENESGELTRELLLSSAKQIDALEAVAAIGLTIVKQVPRSKGRNRLAVKVDVNLLADLAGALDSAGKNPYNIRV